MNTAVIWHVTPFSLVNIEQSFREAYCLHHKGDVMALMIEAVTASGTLFSIYQTTRRNIPEDSHLQSEMFLNASHQGTQMHNRGRRMQAGRRASRQAGSWGQILTGTCFV
jgi:hypothetical protein